MRSFLINTLALTVFSAALMAAFVLTEVVVFAFSDGHWPTEARSPAMEFWNLFRLLWEQNPWGAIKLLLQEPLLEIAHVDPETELNLWRIYYYWPAFIAHIIAAVVLVLSWFRLKPSDVAGWVVAGVSVLLLVGATTYVSHASHCSGPTWLFDTLLRAFDSPFNETSRFWEDKSITAQGVFTVMQWSAAVAAVLLAWRMLTNRRDRSSL